MTYVPESMDQGEITTSDSMGGDGGTGPLQDQNLQRRILLIKNTAPIYGTSPDAIKVATIMAQSSMDDATLIKNVKLQASMQIVEGIRKQIDHQTDDLQKWKMWNQLDETQQGLLKQSGYVPPPKTYDPGDTSVLGITKGIVGGLVHDVTSVPGVKQVLGGVGKGISQFQHLERAASEGIGSVGSFGMMGSEPTDNVFSPSSQLSSFQNLWDKTGNGEKTFAVKAQDRIHEAIPEADKYDFVASMAAGESVEGYLTNTLKMKRSDPLFTDNYMKYSQYLTDKKVSDSIADLKNNKVSFGRDLAGGMGLKRGTAPFTVLSGGLDAAFDVTLDPFIWATGGLTELRLARTGLDASKLAEASVVGEPGYLATRVDQLKSMPKFDRAMGLIADRFNTDQVVRLMDEMPSVRYGVDSMAGYFKANAIGEVTKEDVVNYFKSEGAKADLLKGQFSMPHYPGITIPSMSRVQELKSTVSFAVKSGIENFRLADYGFDGFTPEQLSEVFQGRVAGIGPKWKTMAQAQNGIGEFLKSFVTKVPHQDWIDPMDQKAPQVFRSMMDYVLPKDLQEGFMSDFLAGNTIEQRRAVYNQAIDSMWHYSGAYGTDAGKDIYRQITQADQVYMDRGMDVLNGRPAGVLESDAAGAWAIPSFRDMLKATKDTTQMRRYLDETNDGLVGKFINHWRPTVLLRAGFIPRAYGEELLSFVSREGFSGLRKSYAALAATSNKQAMMARPMQWMADSFLDHIPIVGDHVQMVAQNLAKYTDQYFKDFAEKFAPDEYLQGAREISKRNAVKNALARETGTFQGIADESLGERYRREQINVKSANGDIGTKNVKFGQIVTHMRGDAFYHHTVAREMKRVAESELGRPVMDIMRRQFLQDEGEGLAQLLKDTGALPDMEPHIPMVQTEPKLEGMTKQEWVDTYARDTPKLKQSTIEGDLLHHPFITPEATSHPDIYAFHDGDSSTYHMYDPEHKTLIGHTKFYHGVEDDVPEVEVQIHPEHRDTGVEEKLVELGAKEVGIDPGYYQGFDKTRYFQGQEFDKYATRETVPGEPEPRTDLNYGHALLRARQWVPEAIMPKFEAFLKDTNLVTSGAVVKELVENGMEEGHAANLLDALERMSPRQRTAIFTQDGPLERMLQAKILDPNAAFEMSDVPGYTSERYYHGTYRLPESGRLNPIHYEEGNLVGPGFYTTADPGLADSYTSKGTSGAAQRKGIWQLGWQGKKAPNLLDLNSADIPEDVNQLLKKHFGEDIWDETLNSHYVDPNIWRVGGSEVTEEQALEEHGGQTLGEVLNHLSFGMNPNTARNPLSGDEAKAFIDDLNKAGYDGYTHIGGLFTGGKEHKVSIFFDTSRLGVLRAPTTNKVPGFLPTVRTAVEQHARKEYEQRLLDAWSQGGMTQLIGPDIARERLTSGDMSHLGQVMRRGSEIESDVVAAPPVAGSRRVYTILGPPNLATNPTADLKFAPLGGVFDHQAGWVPLANASAAEGPIRIKLTREEIAGIGEVASPIDTSIGTLTVDELKGEIAARQQSMVDSQTRSAAAGLNPQQIAKDAERARQDIQKVQKILDRADPVISNEEALRRSDAAWFSSDHKDAQLLQQKLQRYKPGTELRVGYVDVPEEVFRDGQMAAKTESAGGLHPLATAKQSNHVWLPKNYRQSYQALSDEGVLLEPAVAEGNVRLYSSTSDIQHQTGSYSTYHPTKETAQIRLPDDERPMYIDVPHAVAAERMAGEGEYAQALFKPEEYKPQSLDTSLSTGVDQSDAFREWGHKVSQKVHQVFGGNEGGYDEKMADVVHKALEGKLKVDDLWPLQTDQLAAKSIGPQILTSDPDGFMKDVYRYGFDKITQAGDAIIRTPMFLHNYVKYNAEIRAVVEQQIGDAGANRAISEIADHLGTKPHRVLTAWHSLPDEIKQAVNPLEAAIARDPIPPNIRLLEGSQKDLQKLSHAGEAIYNNKDGSAAAAIEKEITKKGIGIEGAFPSLAGLEAGEKPTLSQLIDSYLSMPEKMRGNIIDNGLPEVFPKDLLGEEGQLDADQWTKLRDAVETNKHVEDVVHDITTQRAIKDTIPWIHDHHLRSQFQEHAKNFIPFWFAQENFIGRVANLVERDPGVIRKAQLALHGMQTFGAIDKNQFGEDVFNIPATGALMKILQKGANVFGRYSIPIVDPMSGQVKYALPGLDELSGKGIAPSFSPIATLPLQGLTRLFPELHGIYEYAAGERGAGKSVVEQLVPSWAYNTYRGLVHDPQADHAMVSTQIQTAQRMEAAGLGISEKDANSLDTPSEVFQQYIDRLQNHTRLATIVKGLVGFFSPVSPDINPDDNGLSEDFQNILKSTGNLDDAMTAYMAQHPDGLPYTVMKSKVSSGAPLPSTAEALSVLDENPEFFSKYPNAGAWFLPQQKEGDSFSSAAYNQQMAMNLRVNKSLKDWYKDYYFASAAPDYFDTEKGFNIRYAQAKGDSATREQLKAKWDEWKAGYFGQHPVFAEEIQSPEGKQRRERIINEMGDALDDPNAPDVLHAQGMRDMLDTYNGYKKTIAQFPHNTNADQAARSHAKDMFNAWAVTYVADNPQVGAFFTRVIQPTVGG